jgi:hypothetical protein
MFPFDFKVCVFGTSLCHMSLARVGKYIKHELGNRYTGYNFGKHIFTCYEYMIMIIKLTIYVNYSSVFVAHETCMRNNRG